MLMNVTTGMEGVIKKRIIRLQGILPLMVVSWYSDAVLSYVPSHYLMVYEKCDQQTAAHVPSKQSAVPWCHVTEQPGAPCVRRTCGSWLVSKVARGMHLQPGGPPPVWTTKKTTQQRGWTRAEIQTKLVFSNQNRLCVH